MSAREVERRWREKKGLMEERMLGGLLGAVTVTGGALGVMLHPGKVWWNVASYTFPFFLFCWKRDSSAADGGVQPHCKCINNVS